MSVAMPLSVLNHRISLLPFQVALFCVLWSLAFAVAKVALADCPPLLMVRSLIAGLVMRALAALRKGEKPLRWRDLACLP
jgi:drug/metabolite transporter (DMT)-like permease